MAVRVHRIAAVRCDRKCTFLLNPRLSSPFITVLFTPLRLLSLRILRIDPSRQGVLVLSLHLNVLGHVSVTVDLTNALPMVVHPLRVGDARTNDGQGWPRCDQCF